MAVRIQRNADARMTKALTNRLWMNALLQHERGVCVPEVVKPDVHHAYKLSRMRRNARLRLSGLRGLPSGVLGLSMGKLLRQ